MVSYCDMKKCSLKLNVDGRDIDTFAASEIGLQVAHRAAKRAAAGIFQPQTRVIKVCGKQRQTLTTCTAEGCSNGLNGPKAPSSTLRSNVRLHWRTSDLDHAVWTSSAREEMRKAVRKRRRRRTKSTKL